MRKFNNSHINIPKNSTIIIGFSGGPDSVFLLLYLKEIESSHNLKLIAAHLDHEWRSESNKELTWCQQFCKTKSIDFISEQASNISIQKTYNGSKEQHARYLRRAFFENIAKKHRNPLIALAHHKNDQLETFFIRLARGTSLQGLSGIKEHDGLYIRPLINISKQEILDYLIEHNISFLEDPSNENQAFLRNRIRHQLIPILPMIDLRLSDNILTTMKHLESVNDLLQQVTILTISNITTSKKPLSLNTKEFLKLHSILQQRIILQLLILAEAKFTPSIALFKEIVRFLKTSNRKFHTMHETYQIAKDEKSFSIIQQ